MIITALKPQRNRRQRFNLFVDDKFVCALDAEQIVKHKLYVNSPLTSEQIAQLRQTDEFSRWYNQTLLLLSRRPRSRQEILQYLKRKHVGEDLAEQIMEKLVQRKLIDDTAFAKWFIEQRHTFRPKGKMLLKLELRQKGIAPEVVNAVIAETGETTDEITLALEVMRKKLRQPLGKMELRQKIASILGRRGFSWDVIEQVYRTLESSLVDGDK